MEFEDGASEAGSSVTPQKMSYNKLKNMLVTWDYVKHRACKCCGSPSSSDTPFRDGSLDDCTGGKLPWKSYVTSRNPEYKEVTGSHCDLCRETFIGLGYRQVYGSLPNYLSETQNNPDGPVKHRTIIKARLGYIQAANDNPEGPAQYIKTAIKAAYSEVREEERGGQRVINWRTFVIEKVWEELHEGKPEAALFSEKDTTRMLDYGPGWVGYWTTGQINIHLPGHHELEGFREKSVVLSKTHASSHHQFSKTQARDQFERVAEAIRSGGRSGRYQGQEIT